MSESEFFTTGEEAGFVGPAVAAQGQAGGSGPAGLGGSSQGPLRGNGGGVAGIPQVQRRDSPGHARGGSGNAGSDGSGNLGFARRTGNRRVIGTSTPLVSLNDQGLRAVVKSYKVSDTMQFNQVEEMQADAISRDYAQQIMEDLFVKAWVLNTGDAIVMRKAEDYLFAFLAVRGASPFANYDLAVMLGSAEVNMVALSDLLKAQEVTRRQFTRAVADDIRGYIKAPENVILRDRIQTKLGIYPQYVMLGFDGSTHCSGMNRNEVAFTKALESRNLFDDESVKGSLKNSSLIDGVFDTSGSLSKR